MKLQHASFFSGEGGFDLAAEWAGWENIFHCEINPFCQRILQYYWPNAICYGNIKETDFTIHRGRIDIITGGFPCQPYSVAGKRLGKEDDRHLWPEMLRGIREIQPPWVVGENVRGLINWNGGLVFDEVQADLEALGYEVTPFILPACAVNAPHRRDRVWFVAYSNSYGHRRETGFRSYNQTERESQSTEEERQRIRDAVKRNVSEGTTAYTYSEGLSGLFRGQQPSVYIKEGSSQRGEPCRTLTTNERWAHFPTEPPVCIGNDGIPSGLDGITVSDWIKESLKAHGNAIVPQVAYEIFKVINEMSKE